MTCETLVNLCNFVETTSAGSRMDVIRVVCTRCEKLEVCPAVTEAELDRRESRSGKSADEQ